MFDCYFMGIQVIDRSFGFDTAVEEAQRAINAAHVEAESMENGVGVVKLMGRHSGILHFYESTSYFKLYLAVSCVIYEDIFITKKFA